MKKTLLTILRNRKTTRHHFRHATEQVSMLLAGEAGSFLTIQPEEVETPMGKTTGEKIANGVVVIPILRAGLAMLPAFLDYFPDASVGFFGMRRNEETKEPSLYYENLPELLGKEDVILIDPMVATGGSGLLAIRKLLSEGVEAEKIIYVCIVAAPEGVEKLKQEAPGLKLVIGQVDERLNDEAFIVPGIGDFGDRYFGTEDT